MNKYSSTSRNQATPLTIPEIDHLLANIKTKKEHGTLPQKVGQPTASLSIKEITKKVDDASKQMEEMFQHIKDKGKIPLSEIKEDILPTIKQAAEIPHLYHLFYELNSKDEYTYRHTICVGIIATLIGKWLKLHPNDLTNLTLGATLHDIGKTKIPTEILNKPGKLTKEEYSEMKLHTVYGYELLKGIQTINERVALVALQHHEREDGRGYPFGLKSHQIDAFSKIVSIADVFHAMSSSRVYHQASPFYLVMKQMQEDAFGKFDPNIMLIFLYKLMDSLTGKKVQLTDGSFGTILMIHPYDPLRSLVKVNDQLIDLRYNRELQITQILEEED
ncbi:HD-GYP domain-containing protein [Cytobacillus sp. FJAT-54145]|uniref:HD-GYP domain-containing protein n=1 Tax=Cytobacillus spartinae TaxID=3299023 RepID=A0ABW6KD97_9BACI